MFPVYKPIPGQNLLGPKKGQYCGLRFAAIRLYRRFCDYSIKGILRVGSIKGVVICVEKFIYVFHRDDMLLNISENLGRKVIMALDDKRIFKLNQPPSPYHKSDTSSVSEMLTPSEIAQVQRDKKELNAYIQKAFEHLGPKKK